MCVYIHIHTHIIVELIPPSLIYSQIVSHRLKKWSFCLSRMMGSRPGPFVVAAPNLCLRGHVFDAPITLSACDLQKPISFFNMSIVFLLKSLIFTIHNQPWTLPCRLGGPWAQKSSLRLQPTPPDVAQEITQEA